MTRSSSPGSPNPIRKQTRISGVPRKTSVYAIARPRNGAAPRPGSPRTMATPSASTSTSASATTIIFRFSLKPAQTSGSASRKLCGLKNDSRTSRRAFIRATSLLQRRLLQRRHLREVDREPLLLQGLDLPALPQLVDLRVDHRLELRVVRQHAAVLLVRDHLSGDGAVRQRPGLLLGGDDRHVEDQGLAAVDVHRRERRDRRLVDERRLRRMQLRLDPVEAGGVRLRARLELAEVGEALGGSGLG